MAKKKKETPKPSFANPGEYLQLELARIEILIGMQEQFAADPPENLSTEEAEAFAAEQRKPQEDAFNQIEGVIAEKSASLEWLLPIHVLSELYDLGPIERSIIHICVAPYLSPLANQYYRAMNGAGNHSHASPYILQSLLAPGIAEDNYNEVRRQLSSESVLLRKHILRIQESGPNTTSLLAPIEVDQRLIDFLLGNDVLDSELTGFLIRPAYRSGPVETLEELPFSADLIHNLGNAALRLQRSGTDSNETVQLHLHGPAGAGKTRAVYALSRSLEREFLELSLYRLLLAPLSPRESMERALREAELRGAFLLIKECDILSDKEARTSELGHVLPELIQESAVPVVFVSKSPANLGMDLSRGWSATIEFPVTPFEARKNQWEFYLNGHGKNLERMTPEILADRFNFTGGQIQKALNAGRSRADLRGPGEQLSDDDILAGCRAQSNRNLAKLAAHVPAKFGWEDLILPEEQLKQLQRVQNHLKYREKVYAEWGYEKKIAAGRGLNVLFTGVSGTGKTMAASVIASGLGLELYKIDLSSVVSKYIGETEKNLSRIFEEAETANAVLFFDEADALFGKRSEVKDAHDRYANIEVGYLLQRMEDFRGMTILATNMGENMDKAFMRRLHFILDFRPPNETERQKLWELAFPAGAPIEDDLDYAFMAKKFKITAADIKNIALSAAFFAVAEDRPISMSHLMQATKAEIIKSGKPFQESDVGEYFKLTVQSQA